MSDLRAPDPTLTALPPDTSVWIDDTHPRVAHRSSNNPRCVESQWHEEVQDARWFAIPCRDCFPGAPPPGHTPACNCARCGDGHPAVRPSPYLSWQTGGDR